MAIKRAMTTDESIDGWGKPPPLNSELGSPFGYYDRLFYGWSEDGQVFDYGDWQARDFQRMLERDYKAQQIENVLSLPVLSAERQINAIDGDKGESDWLEGFWDADPFDGGCKTSLDQIIGSCTTAFTYRKAFMEKVFRIGYEGKVVYDKVAFRPATTCRMKREAKNGIFTGFEQESYAPLPNEASGVYPIQIPAKRAFVYLHNQRRDPMNGSSDLEITYWCYKTKQKLIFLWFQFLESVALPRTVVKANDVDVAKQIASKIAMMRGSAVIPVGTGGATESVGIDTLDSSGKGADQFMAAISWLDTAATDSILAGFLNLTGAAANGMRGGYGGGSFALSRDASDYYLQFEEAKCREIERSIRRDLFAPLIRYNFGPKGHVPRLKFEPLNSEDKSNQIAMLTALMAAKGPLAVPDDFVAMLAQQTANYFGMNGTEVHDAFVKAGAAAAAQAAAASEAGAAPVGQAVATLTGATDTAASLVKAGGPKKELPSELAKLDWSKIGG